jgi:hypothetical protein
VFSFTENHIGFLVDFIPVDKEYVTADIGFSNKIIDIAIVDARCNLAKTNLALLMQTTGTWTQPEKHGVGILIKVFINELADHNGFTRTCGRAENKLFVVGTFGEQIFYVFFLKLI